jgi:aldehyde dehydrogenase (NAD+)
MTVEVTREPLGVIGMITPWNFPIAIPAWKIAPALAYGNTVVIKPAEAVPGCATELVKILEESGLPAGVVNLVLGPGRVIGEALVTSSDIDAISFTGSEATGRAIAAKCVASGKKVQLEMGGKNPLVVVDDADLDVAVDAALDGSFFSTGQRCTASSRLIVTSKIHDQFVEALQRKASALVVGHALDKSTQIGPVVDDRQLQQNLNYLKIAGEEGGQVLGGDLVERPTKGYFMRPALVIGTDNTMRINREEVFGPVASVITVAGYEEALAVANDTPYGLAAGICTTSLKYSSHFKRHAEAGMVMVNAPTAGVDYHVPFGGRKRSSYGPREQGSYAREFYTVVKTAYVRA